MKERVKNFRIESINTLFNKLTFLHILIIWVGILLFFGLIYYFFDNQGTQLMYTSTRQPVTSFSDNVYFSFVTATSTGYGDIIPMGLFKVLAVMEVITGLVLLAVVTSKLVSIKQDVIMNEIYEISFNERINRIRSSMLVFRQNLNRMINNIESNSIRNREISDIFNYISSLEDVLNEITNLIERKSNSNFTKELDAIDIELIFNSVTQSFEKLYEEIHLMNMKELEWKRDITLALIERCIMTNSTLFEALHDSRKISDKEYTDMSLQNKKAIDNIKTCIDADKKPFQLNELEIEKVQ
jgi:potassium channel LctB